MTDNNNDNRWLADNLLNDDFLESFNFFDQSKRVTERRSAVRYIRNDIQVTICSLLPFGFGNHKTVKLININSRGVLLESRHSLGLSKVITLNLKFKSGKEFKIKGRIVNHSVLASVHYEGVKYYYGIKFDCYNNELGDYLAETQNKLIIK